MDNDCSGQLTPSVHPHTERFFTRVAGWWKGFASDARRLSKRKFLALCLSAIIATGSGYGLWDTAFGRWIGLPPPIAGGSPGITQTLLTSGNNANNQSSYATASVTPTANRLVLVSIRNQGGPPTTAVNTVTGNSLTYVSVRSQENDTTRASVYRALGASPAAGAITIDFNGVNQGNCAWVVSEFTGMDTGGANGSAAVVQSADNTATSATSLTVTLAAFGQSNNATYGAFANAVDAAVTQGSGFTLVADVTSETAQGHLGVEFRADPDTSVDMSGSSSNWVGIAIEIKDALPPNAAAIAVTLPSIVPAVSVVWADVGGPIVVTLPKVVPAIGVEWFEVGTTGILPEPGEWNFTLYRNAYFERFIEVYLPTPNGPKVMELQHHTARMQLRTSPESALVVLELSTANGRITITPNHEIKVKLTDTETSTMDGWIRPLDYDLIVTSPSGQDTIILRGKVSYVPTSTRDGAWDEEYVS